MIESVTIADRQIDGLPHQVQFWNNEVMDAQVALVAGLGQGKSYALFIKGMRLASKNPGLAGMLVVPTLTMAKKIHISEWPGLAASFGVKLTFHAQDSYFSWPWGRMWLGSAENPDRLAGPNLAYCMFDELGLQTKRAYQRGRERVRHGDATLRQTCVGGTPEGLNFYSELFGEPDESKKIYTIRGQSWHPKISDYRQTLKDQYGSDKALMDAYARGIFCPLREGRVYHPFNRHIHVGPTEYEPSLPLVLGCDFNVDGMTWQVMQFGPDWINFLDEIALESNGTTREAANVFLSRWGPKGETRHVGEVIVCGDAAGQARSTSGVTDYQTITEVLGDAGFASLQRKVPRSNPMQKDRADNMNRHLAGQSESAMRVTVNPENKRIIKDFERVVWKHSTSGSHSIDKKDPELTHASDGGTYAVWMMARMNVSRFASAGGTRLRRGSVSRAEY